MASQSTNQGNGLNFAVKCMINCQHVILCNLNSHQASLIHSYDWKLEDGVTPENMNMEERYGISLQKAQPLQALPVRV